MVISESSLFWLSENQQSLIYTVATPVADLSRTWSTREGYPDVLDSVPSS